MLKHCFNNNRKKPVDAELTIPARKLLVSWQAKPLVFSIACSSGDEQLIRTNHEIHTNGSTIIPQGSLQPSESDRALTRKLVSAGKVLDIPVLDHLILTSEEYFSFADEGLINL